MEGGNTEKQSKVRGVGSAVVQAGLPEKGACECGLEERGRSPQTEFERRR